MKNKNKIKHGSVLCDVILYIIAGILCLITLYPMYYVLIMSISDSHSVMTRCVYFFPKNVQFDSYRAIIGRNEMWRAYAYTVFYVAAITALVLITSLIMAYPLTVKNLKGKKLIIIFLLIPMYFGGGLIPQFLLMTKLGLYNNIWAMILPGCFNIWYLILVKTYLSSIPDSMREAAAIDGANHYQILSKIYIPLAKPILAVIAIYSIVDVWNGWFHANIYLTDTTLQPLQLYLRRVLVEQSANLTEGVTAEEAAIIYARQLSNIQLQYAMIIFTTLPVIFTYPFLQKYFVKGVMMGSLKG